MNEKYYVVYFDEDATDMTLFENKFLKRDEYTQSEENMYTFTDVVYEAKKLKSKVDFVDEPFNYDGYKLIEETCYSCNDYKKDGFRYDKKNQRVVYGNTPIYVSLEGDCFVDVVTGRVIPRTIIKKTIEIDSAKRLSAMANDLISLSKYVDIYSVILSDWIAMFSSDFVNMKAIQNIHDELCLEKYNELYVDLSNCDFYDMKKQIADENIIEVGQHQRVKTIIGNIRKSS